MGHGIPIVGKLLIIAVELSGEKRSRRLRLESMPDKEGGAVRSFFKAGRGP